MERLDELIKRAEDVCASKALTRHDKDAALASMMTTMEQVYGVPVMKDPKWEAAHPDVFRAYKKISDMREL